MPSLLAPWPCPFPRSGLPGQGPAPPSRRASGEPSARSTCACAAPSQHGAWPGGLSGERHRGSSWHSGLGQRAPPTPTPDLPDWDLHRHGDELWAGRRAHGKYTAGCTMEVSMAMGWKPFPISVEIAGAPPQASPFISFQETFQTRFAHAFETNMVWPNPCDHFINQRLPSPWECSWRPRGNGDHPWE